MAQVSLQVAILALGFFAPTLGRMARHLTDASTEIYSAIQEVRERKYCQALHSAFRASTDLLWLAALGYGGIELTLATFTVQLIINSVYAVQSLRRREYGLALAHLISGAFTVYCAIPQIRLYHWLSKNSFKMEGTLQKAENGFVYLDVSGELLATKVTSFQ